MANKRLVFVVGTRPDAIKSAPVVLEFKKYSELVDTVLVSTGQHTEMLQQVFDTFDLTADHAFVSMSHGQSLSSLTSKVLLGLDKVFAEVKPDLVFAQGDTTTTFVAGLSSFYHQIPFAHIEAGLRTSTVTNPFPEEYNRRAVTDIAAYHFPPTTEARDNLLRDGVDESRVFVTGNTGIDAVMATAKVPGKEWFEDHEGRVILLTTHRRENWGDPQREIATAAREILDKFDDLLLVVPMHKNPAVRETLKGVLDGHPRVRLIEPPAYADFVKLMVRADIVLTDSGGIQEEAPSFGKPVLVLRDTTERPEGIRAGTAKLVGTDKDKIIAETCSLLTSSEKYEAMAKAVSPYGDGKASSRIRSVVLHQLRLSETVEPMWA